MFDGITGIWDFRFCPMGIAGIWDFGFREFWAEILGAELGNWISGILVDIWAVGLADGLLSGFASKFH